MTIDKIINKFSKKDLNNFKKYFKPVMPKSWNNDPDEWLTTINIEKVLDRIFRLRYLFNIITYLGAWF